MNYQHAVDRLWNHSDLPKSFSSENESLIFCLYKAERNNQPPQIASLVEDVIHCLELVNKELNGPNPSETFRRTNPAVLEQVSYPISGIIYGIMRHYRSWKQSGLFDRNILDALLDAVLKISYAWDQVLAGDIDDILEGLDIE
jgi:hypothetical protein